MKPRTVSDFRMSVRNYLKAGYGVEDIALLMSEPLTRVRLEVERLRDAGELEGLFRD